MLKIGDKVRIRPSAQRAGDAGMIFEVKRFLQVNVEVEPLGGGRKLRGRPELFELATGAGTAPVTPLAPHGGCNWEGCKECFPAAPVAPQAVSVPYLPWLGTGQLVRVQAVSHTRWVYPKDQLFVVINQNAAHRVKIVKLGGEQGRTWTISRDSCTLVDLADVLK